MHTISKILEINPYIISVVFDNKESRTIDFTELINSFPVLKNEAIFKSVKLDDYPTLAWENQASIMDYDGTIKPTTLDFCPDSLYKMSQPV